MSPHHTREWRLMQIPCGNVLMEKQLLCQNHSYRTCHPILIRSWKILMKENHEYFKDNSLLVKYLNSALLLLSFCLQSSLLQWLSWGTLRCTNCSAQISSKHWLWFLPGQLWSKDLLGRKAPSCRTVFVRFCQHTQAYPSPLHNHWHGFLVTACCQNNLIW